jgi:eukaryotic translation initiation factor 2C
MAGAAKQRVLKERAIATPSRPNDSSSGENSSSGKATRSVHSDARSAAPSRSAVSRGQGFDGNNDDAPAAPTGGRNPNTSRVIVDPRNLDLGNYAWTTIRGQELSSNLPPRPQPSKLGQAIKVGLNTFHVENFPDKPVYQYDVSIGKGDEKRGAIAKVWESKAVQAAVGKSAIFDGNKLMWSDKSIDREVRLTVNLNEEEGRPPGKTPEKTIFRVVIRQTNAVRFETLRAHLQGKASFDNGCLEAINFFDHLLRNYPRLKYTPVKRAFFAKGESRFELGSGVEAFKGVYQSLRLVHPGRLSVNLDVANGTFWTASLLTVAAAKVAGCRDVADLSATLTKTGQNGRAAVALKKLRKVHVEARHRGKNEIDRYCIERLVFTTARNMKFKKDDGTETSVYDFFAKTYNIRLQYPDLPLVKATKGKNTYLPMEILTIKENQRYNYKMDERQTSNMIKFAVTAPPERWNAIEHGLKMLSWSEDPYLQKYGVKINPKKTVADSRLLPAPTVKYGAGDAKPGTSGRWDLKNKKFLLPNPTPLKSWAVCVISGRRGGKPDKSVVEKWISEFCKGYAGLGGKVENKNPAMVLASGDDPATWVTNTWNAAGTQSSARPQMLMFILPDKDSITYGKIKRSCECRYGVVSQCVQYAHAQKAQLQYIANVCMKFNAKLGGTTCRAMGKTSSGPNGLFTSSTMIIGADVSHSAPGVDAPSMAALTVSIDRLATRYAATCQTNGYRVEMINTDIINSELKSMVQHWMSAVGNGKLPSTVYYLRDGVSEGQYQQVLQYEVADMKALFKKADANNNTKFVVVVGSKRHHIRFFPERGDKNGNAMPGTLVETGVTNPIENDFYLCGHHALKGTARPVHYYVLMNEAGVSNDFLQTMLYEHVYQYARATTPVSIHPAIYYAHLASNRAVPHDEKWGSQDAPQSKAGSGSQGRSSGSSSGAPTEFKKLLPMPNQGSINSSMW